MKRDIILTICCITYNHKNYIGKALESFLNQKVDFNYEIIVHDDRSTDGTTEILKKFQKKYSDIIKPIYQIENQYSQGVNILEKCIFPRAKGKYLALCEGDDFWCDETKLQKQVDFLNEHMDYCACVHNTLIWDQKTNESNKKFNEIDSGNQDITVERILQWDTSVPFHTSSILCRKIIFEKEMPRFFTLPKCFGDYPLALYMAMKGKIAFFDDIMSVYRMSVPNSYSSRMKDTNLNIKKELEKLHMLEEFNQYSRFKYDEIIKEKILEIEFRLNLIEKNFKKVFLPQYKKIRQSMRISQRIKLYIKAYCIHVYRIYCFLKVKNKVD